MAHLHQTRSHLTYRFLSAFIAFTFLFTLVLPPAPGEANSIPQLLKSLPPVGTMVGLSEPFFPAIIRGLVIHPDNPLEFDFIVDTGDDELKGAAFEEEARRLVKYFLAALTVPENELWVNLSPYEKDRIIPQGLGVTEMGMDMLAQDYLLKQLTASTLYPENELGSRFWKKVRSEVKKRYGTTEIPVNTFNKVWIVPDVATVYEHNGSVFVVERHLRVMLENDYLALQETQMNTDEKATDEHRLPNANIAPEIIKEIIIPAIEKEVNEGKNFAKLRQIYNSMILATWYKKNLRESLLGQVYAGQNKTKGIDIEEKNAKEELYNQYLAAFKKGVYNYIREDTDEATQPPIPRKYFSGGLNFGITTARQLNELHGDPARLSSKVSSAVEEPESKKGHDQNVTVTLVENQGVEEASSLENSSSSPIFSRSTQWYIDRLGYQDEHVRMTAIRKLAKRGDKLAINPLLRMLRTEDFSLYNVLGKVEAALKELGATKEQLVNGYIDALSSHYSYAHTNAVEKLGQLGDKRAINPLLAALRLGNYYGGLDSVTRALQKLGATKEQMVSGYIVALSGGHGALSAAKALGQLGDIRAIAFLSTIIEEKADWQLIETSMESLNKLKSPSIYYDVLQKLKEHNSFSKHKEWLAIAIKYKKEGYDFKIEEHPYETGGYTMTEMAHEVGGFTIPIEPYYVPTSSRINYKIVRGKKLDESSSPATQADLKDKTIAELQLAEKQFRAWAEDLKAELERLRRKKAEEDRAKLGPADVQSPLAQLEEDIAVAEEELADVEKELSAVREMLEEKMAAAAQSGNVESTTGQSQSSPAGEVDLATKTLDELKVAEGRWKERLNEEQEAFDRLKREKALAEHEIAINPPGTRFLKVEALKTIEQEIADQDKHLASVERELKRVQKAIVLKLQLQASDNFANADRKVNEMLFPAEGQKADLSAMREGIRRSAAEKGQSLFSNLPLGDQKELRPIYAETQGIVEGAVGKDRSTPIDLSQIHLTIATQEVGSDPLQLTMEQVKAETQEDATEKGGFQVRLLGPHLMPNGSVIMEYEVLDQHFVELREKASERIAGRKLSSGNRASVPSIYHSSVDFLIDENIRLEELQEIERKLTAQRQEIQAEPPVFITVKKGAVSIIDSSTRKIVSTKEFVLGPAAEQSASSPAGWISHRRETPGDRLNALIKQGNGTIETIKPDAGFFPNVNDQDLIRAIIVKDSQGQDVFAFVEIHMRALSKVAVRLYDLRKGSGEVPQEVGGYNYVAANRQSTDFKKATPRDVRRLWNGLSSSHEQLIESGALHFSSKLPAFFDELQRSFASSPVKIMLVDDSKAIRDLFYEWLKEGFPNAEIVVAGDGTDALQQLRQMEVKPDLVVTDLNMPKKTGADLARAIRKEGIPTKVVVMTMADVSNELDRLLKEEGLFDGVVNKLAQFKPWVDLVKEFLPLEQPAASSPAGEEAPGGIDFNPELWNLQIKRDGNGVPLPLPQQPIGNMKIDGFLPVIINIAPVNIPLLLGMKEEDSPAELSAVR